MKAKRILWMLLAISISASTPIAQQSNTTIPADPLKFGAFTVRFDPGGTFSIASTDWPPLKGNWKAAGDEIEFKISEGPGGCDGPGRYRIRSQGNAIGFDVIEDQCQVRRMIIDRSTWSPASEARVIPVRNIVRTGNEKTIKLAAAKSSKGSWPSFRGPDASGIADGQSLPDKWDVKTGENIL